MKNSKSDVIKIKLDKEPYEEGQKIFTASSISIKPGINSLVGCNGSGKSTYLKQLETYLRHNDIPCCFYNDRQDGGFHKAETQLEFFGNPRLAASMFCSSEGERIVLGFSDIIGGLQNTFRKLQSQGHDTFVLGMDCFDSGMSVDMIEEIRDMFTDLVLPDAKNRYGINVYLVVAGNTFEWCEGLDINNIDIVTGKELCINTYNDWRDAVMETRKYKDKREEQFSKFREAEKEEVCRSIGAKGRRHFDD